MQDEVNFKMVDDPDANPIGNYVLLMEALGVDIKKPHWYAKQIPDKIGIKIVREFWTKLKGDSFLGMNLRQNSKKFGCPCRGCLNPAHYSFMMKNANAAKFTDIKELADEIDLALYNELGFKMYLEVFNENTLLPASERDMKLAIEYAKTQLSK